MNWYVRLIELRVQERLWKVALAWELLVAEPVPAFGAFRIQLPNKPLAMT